MNKSDNKTLNIFVYDKIKVSDSYKPKKKFNIIPQTFPLIYKWSFKDLAVINNNFTLAPPFTYPNNSTFKITP